MANLNLILGGARSGKSSYAERLALTAYAQADASASDGQVASRSRLIYLATGAAGDQEMAIRIDHHQTRRSEQKQAQNAPWKTLEEPLNLGRAVSNLASDSVVLIDCLTLWLSNCLHHSCWPTEKAAFIHALSASKANIIMVSNEVGSGIVPMGELSRQFVDESGWLHQQLAEICGDVTLVVAGLPMSLKQHK